MGLVKEFKEFALKGNVMDMAVGVIIGGAFGKIISSLVDDVIMPLVSVLTGGTDFNKLFCSLDGNTYESLEKAQEAGAAVLTYGTFIQNVLDFFIIALCIFFMVKAMNKLNRKKEEEPAPAEPSNEEKLLGEIRDLLAKK